LAILAEVTDPSWSFAVPTAAFASFAAVTPVGARSAVLT